MTLTDLIPALKGHGSHRAADEVDRLRDDVQQLRTALALAGRENGDLRKRLAAATAEQAEAEMTVVAQQADIDDLRAENEELRGQLAALAAKAGPQLAAEANAEAVTVRPWERDTSAIEDQATAPIDVRPLREAAAAGLL